jgi:Tfp pilus assembly protein PilF
MAEDPLRDLVLLQIKGSGFSFLRLGAFNKIYPEASITLIADPYAGTPATKVFSKPAPRPIGRIITKGTIAEVDNLGGDSEWFSTRIPVEGGESGSPILNATGEAIGMIRGGFAHYQTGLADADYTQTKGLAVSAGYIQSLVCAAGIGSDPRPLATLKKREYDDLFDDLDFKAALQAAQRGKNTDAARLMKLAIGHFPESGAFHVLLGSYYSKLSLWKEANEAFTKATSLNPGNALAWASLGMVLSYQHKAEEAIDACRKAARLESGRSDTWFNIGGAYLLLKHYDEAQAAIQHLRDLNTREAAADADKLTAVLEAKKILKP